MKEQIEILISLFQDVKCALQQTEAWDTACEKMDEELENTLMIAKKDENFL